MTVSTKGINTKKITLEEFLKEHGVTERDLTSDRWLTQIEKNGYGLYCLADSVDIVRDTWDYEFDGERGSMEDNLYIWNVDGLFVAMWSW